jgi:signal transduction histidine kinase
MNAVVERDRNVIDRIRSSTRRIAALVDDVLDLARGRLGGGIALELSSVVDLGDRLRHVVAEVQAAHPERRIDMRFALDGAVRCDPRRIEQVLSNLLANAIEHGTPEAPIEVSVGGGERALELRVANRGATIAEGERARLFQPYFRGGQSGRRDGLGLGLYIVSEIAKSHGGRVDVSSACQRTVFTFTVPRDRR